MEIKNLQSLVNKLQKMAAKVRDDKASVSVGFTANYALFVHENLEARHAGYVFVSYASGKRREYTGVGQAKFLEQPAREKKKELANIVTSALRQRKTMSQALLLAGLRLQREAMLLCPVDTGNLRASAFTRLDVGLGAQ